jgi:opacity protein-like surface antigen
MTLAGHRRFFARFAGTACAGLARKLREPLCEVLAALFSLCWSLYGRLHRRTRRPWQRPYLHANVGDVEFRRGGLGLSVGYVGRRLGFEFDVDRHHHFFKDKELESVPKPCMPGAARGCIDSDTEARIFMGNVVAPIATSGMTSWRPYGSAGMGVIHAWIHDAGEYDTSQTNLALNVGGGVTYRLNNRLALRGDVRYLHAFVDEDKREGAYFKDYGFWRMAFGVTFGFPR